MKKLLALLLLFVAIASSAQTVTKISETEFSIPFYEGEWQEIIVTITDKDAQDYFKFFTEAKEKPEIPILVDKKEIGSELVSFFYKVVESEQIYITYSDIYKTISSKKVLAEEVKIRMNIIFLLTAAICLVMGIFFLYYDKDLGVILLILFFMFGLFGFICTIS